MKSARSTIERMDVEELLEVMGDRSPVGISIIQDGKFCYINPAFPIVTGYSAHELEGTEASELVYPEDREVVRRDAIKMLTGKSSSPSEFRVVCKNGSLKWVMQTVSSIEYRGKRATLVNYMDITERKRAEEALRESEQKYRLLSENASDVIWTTDMNLKYTYVSPSVGKLLGYTPEEFTSFTVGQTLTPTSLELVRRVFEEESAVEQLPHRQQERTRTIEAELVRKDGSTVWVEARMAFVRDEVGGPTGILGIARDVSERKQAEEALRQSEERYRTILEEMEEGYYEQDLAGTFTFVNDAMCRLLGYSRDELTGMSYQAYTPEDDVERRQTVWNKVYGTGEPVKCLPLENIRKDGTRVFVEDSVFPLQDERGEIVGFRGVSRDVTERKHAEQALRRSEERYRTILEEMEDSYFEVDLGGHFTFVNSAVCRNLGYSREELIGMSYKGFAAEEDIGSVFRVFNEVYRTGRPNKGFAWRIVPRNGSPWFVDTSVSPLRNNRDQIVGFRGVARDITERKKMEEALELQRAQFQQLFDGSPDAIAVLDTDERVMQANTSFETLFGYTAEEIKGRPINELVIPPNRAKEGAALSRMVLHGRFVREEEVRRRKDGSLVDVSIVGYPVRAEGNLAGIYVIYSDITKRKKMEEAIKRAAEEWRETFDSISDAVSIHSNDFRLRRVNRAFADRLGMSPRQLTGKHCYEVMHGTKEPIAGCPHRETMQTGKPARAELLEAGLGTYFEVTTSPVFDETGKTTGGVHIVRDITEQKQQATQLMMADRLASIGELAAGTAHELNNPLTSVIGFSQLLMEKDVPQDIRGDLELIYSESRRAAEVIKNLLTFARKHAPVKQPNRIDRIMEDVLRLRAYEHKVNNIEVKKHVVPGLPEVVVDYFQMQQVLLNLIINAEYFMTEAHQGGTLTIAVKRRNSTMVISVADDGPGIAQEHLSQLFNPFFTTKMAGKGTGLGLSICHGIVTEHGGRIYARSQPGKGATFYVELPINSAGHSGGKS
ncbi:MAG: PAS domain S-box protein [Dehalococcoidia bacterium]